MSGPRRTKLYGIWAAGEFEPHPNPNPPVPICKFGAWFVMIMNKKIRANFAGYISTLYLIYLFYKNEKSTI